MPQPHQGIFMTSKRFSPSHSAVGLPSVHALAAIAAVGLTGGCPPSGGGGTDDTDSGGPPAQLEPGVIVKCGGDEQGQPRLVCMAKEDFDCINRGKPQDPDQGWPYVRQALCAQAWGGVPGDYVNPPHWIGDGSAQSPVIVSGNGTVDCDWWWESGTHKNSAPPDDPATSIDESTAIVKKMYDDPLHGHQCDDCHTCWRQLEGWQYALYPDDAWDDYPWCPGKGDNIVDLAAYQAMEASNCIADTMTGDDSTTGDDPTTGDPQEHGTYICNGASTICGTMYDTFPEEDTETDHCMGGEGLLPPCVVATSKTAQSECEDHCDLVNIYWANEAAKSLGYKTWVPMDCTQTANFPASKADDPATQCNGGGPMPSFTNPLPFVAAGEMTVGSGSASSDDVVGLLQVDLDGSCPLTSVSCPFSIAQLLVANVSLQGVYNTRDAAGAIVSSTPFTLTNLHVRLVQPAHGEFSPRSGVVSFPTDALYLSIATGEVSLDGVTVSPGSDGGLFMVDGVRGVWNGQQLSLDVAWANAGVSIWLHVTAG